MEWRRIVAHGASRGKKRPAKEDRRTPKAGADSRFRAGRANRAQIGVACPTPVVLDRTGNEPQPERRSDRARRAVAWLSTVSTRDFSAQYGTRTSLLHRVFVS